MSTGPDDTTDTVVVGRIGRPHGVRGEVTVEVRTDDPDLRFAPGAVLRTDPVDRGPLTVAGRRWHREVLLLTIEGVESREAAEELRNTELHVPLADVKPGRYMLEVEAKARLKDAPAVRREMLITVVQPPPDLVKPAAAKPGADGGDAGRR